MVPAGAAGRAPALRSPCAASASSPTTPASRSSATAGSRSPGRSSSSLGAIARASPRSGSNYGIDFKGGILLEARTPGAADLARMRAALGGADLGDVELQTGGAPDDVLIRASAEAGDEAQQQAAIGKIKDTLEQGLGSGLVYQRAEFVGPKVSSELLMRRRLRRPGLARRRLRLSLVPLRVAVRPGRHRLAGPRRLGHHRHLRDLPDRVQPDQRRRRPDPRRLLAQRHRRHLRPRAREPAPLQDHADRRAARPQHQRDAGPHPDDLADHAASPWSPCGSWAAT